MNDRATNGPEHQHLDDERLRAALHRISQWPEPGPAPELAGTSPPESGPGNLPVTRRPMVWAGAAASLVLIVLGAVWVLTDDDDPIVAGPEAVEEPSLSGVIERVPGGLEQLDLVDIRALRAAASASEDPGRRDKTIRLDSWGTLETSALLPFPPGDENPMGEDPLIDPGRIVATASSGGAGWARRIIATTQPVEELATGLGEVGFVQAGPDRYERTTPVEEEGWRPGTTSVVLEPGYVDVLTSFPVPASLPQPDRGTPPLDPPLAALVDAAGGVEAFSAIVTGGSECGSAEALTYGPDGYSWLVVDPDGQLDGWTPDPTEDADVLGRFIDSSAVAGRHLDGVTRFDIDPGPIALASDFPIGVLTVDLPPGPC